MENIIQLQPPNEASIDLRLLLNKLNKLEFQILKLNSFAQKKNEAIIQIHNSDGIHFISVNDIIFIKAEGNYSRVFTKESSPLLVSKTLKHLSHTVLDHGFIRAHQSFIINPHRIQKIIKKGGFQILMQDQTVIPVSRSAKPKLLNLLNIAQPA